MLLSSDTNSRLINFIKKIKPEPATLDMVLKRLAQSDPTLIRFEVGLSRLTDSFSGHLITTAGRDFQIHFYYKDNKFTRIELIDITYPEDFEVIELWKKYYKKELTTIQVK